jgi:glycine cleavage system pyridoxal-binding protein P
MTIVYAKTRRNGIYSEYKKIKRDAQDVGLSSMDDLFSDIESAQKALKLRKLSEMELIQGFRRSASETLTSIICLFLGAGRTIIYTCSCVAHDFPVRVLYLLHAVPGRDQPGSAQAC